MYVYTGEWNIIIYWDSMKCKKTEYKKIEN